MNWGRACWTNRCTHLFGERNDQYRLRRHRLHLQVHIWYESPRTQVLVDRNTFPERASILHRNNEGIARWLDQQHAVRDSRRKRTSQTTGQLTMDRFMGTRASRRDQNLIFQGSLQEARRANLPVINETNTASDGDHSHGGTPPSEEPPDWVTCQAPHLIYFWKYNYPAFSWGEKVVSPTTSKIYSPNFRSWLGLFIWTNYE